jgi:hypothetical protein
LRARFPGFDHTHDPHFQGSALIIRTQGLSANLNLDKHGRNPFYELMRFAVVQGAVYAQLERPPLNPPLARLAALRHRPGTFPMRRSAFVGFQELVELHCRYLQTLNIGQIETKSKP